MHDTPLAVQFSPVSFKQWTLSFRAADKFRFMLHVVKQHTTDSDLFYTQSSLTDPNIHIRTAN